jgi:hypothetical protein
MTVMLTLLRSAYFASRPQHVPNRTQLTCRSQPVGGVLMRSLRGASRSQLPHSELIDNLLKAQTYQARMPLRRALANPSRACSASAVSSEGRPREADGIEGSKDEVT